MDATNWVLNWSSRPEIVPPRLECSHLFNILPDEQSAYLLYAPIIDFSPIVSVVCGNVSKHSVDTACSSL